MPDRSVAGLRATIKALREVVTPAIDPSNPLANEQLRMACVYLELLCEQLPHRSRRITFELRNAIALAQTIRPMAARCEALSGAALEAALSDALPLSNASDRTEAEMAAATAALNAAISAQVRCAAQADDEVRRHIEQAALIHARDWLTVQRAWFAPLSFDLDQASLPSLAQALTDGT